MGLGGGEVMSGTDMLMRRVRASARLMAPGCTRLSVDDTIVTSLRMLMYPLLSCGAGEALHAQGMTSALGGKSTAGGGSSVGLGMECSSVPPIEEQVGSLS